MLKLKKTIDIDIASVFILVIASVLIMHMLPNMIIETSLVKEGSELVILDPGHGGADGGAVSVTGEYESRINLEVSEKADVLFNFFGVSTMLTRESNDIEYPESADTIHKKKVYDQERRIELINSQKNAVLISIHQNKFTSASSKGIQVLYAPTDGSDGFARCAESSFSSIAGVRVRESTQISDTIYLFKNITCPGILIECGFLSNPAEAELLENNEYQTKLAAAIAAGYLCYKINSF